MKHLGVWKLMDDYYGWKLESAIAVCRQLGCGTAVSTRRYEHIRSRLDYRAKWRLMSNCDGSESSLRECSTLLTEGRYSSSSGHRLEITWSGNI